MTILFGLGGFGFGFFSAAADLDFDTLTLYYVNLLIVQYVTKAKARNTTGIAVQELVAQSIDEAVRDAFDVLTAVGAQLDLLAAYRGTQRTIFGVNLTHDYYSYAFYTDPDPTIYKGYAFYTDAVVNWYFLVYADGSNPLYSMTDDELRRLVQFLAKTQSRFLSLQALDDILFNAFGNNVQLNDNGDMTITYVHSLGDPDTLYGIVKDTGNLPAPAGVQVLTA